jgi:hypothetical protein
MLAGRNVDGLPDARTCRLNAGECNGYQNMPPWLGEKAEWNKKSSGQKTEKPPAAFAGGGL